MAKLNQIIAIEKGVKSAVFSERDALYKAIQKPELFDGHAKVYQPVEEGADLPPDNKRVQYVGSEVLRTVERITTELFQIEARKDWTNCVAKADVKLEDGTVIVANAPVPFLLFLEKQLTDTHTFIGKLPVLDEAHKWTLDGNDNLYKTEPTKTQRTEKVQDVLVLYEATDKHPAQVKEITKDKIVGYWNTIKQSGALPKTEKAKMLERVEQLIRAVKEAREEANMTEEAQAPDVGGKIFEFLFPTTKAAG